VRSRIKANPAAPIKPVLRGQERPNKRVFETVSRVVAREVACGSVGQVVICRQAVGSQGR
jgi:hypothetical protein